MPLQEDHFERFMCLRSKEEPWKGDDEASWAAAVAPGVAFPNLAGRRNRDSLSSFCQSAEPSIEEKFIACMAWGRMKSANRGPAWRAQRQWKEKLEQLCSSEALSRRDAYLLLSDPSIPGLGPAYITKLIYFMGRHPKRGYIMDQWTGSSINLLFRREIVRISRRWVTRSNNENNYESFCLAIEEIADRLGEPGGAIEQQLFSIGGHRPGRWRAYVQKNFSSI